MKVDFEVVGARELSLKFSEAPRKIADTNRITMRKVVARLHAYLVRRKLAGDPLKVRTGNLARAVFSRVEGSMRDVLVGRVGIDRAKAIYGRIHEFGGVIRPTKGKYLTIPVGQALTPSGVARFSAREFIEATSAGGGGIGGFTGSFVNKNRTAIMGIRRAGGGVEPVFALKTQVTLPARRPLTQTRDEQAEIVRRAFAEGLLLYQERL